MKSGWVDAGRPAIQLGPARAAQIARGSRALVSLRPGKLRKTARGVNSPRLVSRCNVLEITVPTTHPINLSRAERLSLASCAAGKFRKFHPALRCAAGNFQTARVTSRGALCSATNGPRRDASAAARERSSSLPSA